MLVPRRHSFFWVLGFCWLLCLVHGLLAEDKIPVSEDYLLRTWGVEDGLPLNQVSGIAQTRDGYLWLATNSGVARFDGVRFTVFSKKAAPGILSDLACSVYVSRDETLWIGFGSHGVVRRPKGGNFETVVPLGLLNEGLAAVNSFAEDASGAVWFGEGSGQTITRWKEGKLTHYVCRRGFAPVVAAARNGDLWFSNSDVCGPFDGREFQTLDVPGPSASFSIAASREGGMWIAHHSQLLHYSQAGGMQVVGDLGSLGANVQVTKLFEDRAGDVWIGTTGNGLLRFRQGRFVHVPTSGSDVLDIFEDREESLWVGMRGGGLNSLRLRSFFLRQTRHGLHSDSISSLCEDSEGRLWITGRDGVPVRSLDAHNEFFAAPNNVAGSVYTLCPDPAGGVWMGGMWGLMHWQNEVIKPEPMRQPLTGLLRAANGDVWGAPIHDALVCLSEGKNREISTEGGLIEPRVLAEDVAGRLWVGTEGGLVFMRVGADFVRVPLPGAKPLEPIRFILPDGKDIVWIGSLADGLYRWRAGSVVRLPQTRGCPRAISARC